MTTFYPAEPGTFPSGLRPGRYVHEIDYLDLESDCRWAMSMLVNGIEGRLMDIYDNDLDKVEKASRRMPAFRRAVLWLDQHRVRKEPDHAMERVTGSIGSGD